MDGYSGSYINYPDTDNAVNRSYSNYLSRWYDEKAKALPDSSTSSQISQAVGNRAQGLLQGYLDRIKGQDSQSSASPTSETSETTGTTAASDSESATTTGSTPAAQEFANNAKERVKGLMRGRSAAAAGEGDGEAGGEGGQAYKGAWARLSERYPDMPTGDRKASMEYLRGQLPDDAKGNGIGYFMRRQWGDDHPGRGKGRGGSGSGSDSDSGGGTDDTYGGGDSGSGAGGGGAAGGGGQAEQAYGRRPEFSGFDVRNEAARPRAQHPPMPDMSSYEPPRPRYDSPQGRGYANPTVSRNGRF